MRSKRSTYGQVCYMGQPDIYLQRSSHPMVDISGNCTGASVQALNKATFILYLLSFSELC